MKILFVSEFFPKSEECEIKGGAEARCFYIARELAKKHDVTVISSLEEGTKKRDKFADINVIRCGRKRKYSQGGNLFTRLSFMKQAFEIGSKLDVDLVEGYSFLSYLL